jgi:hypothetical protein
MDPHPRGRKKKDKTKEEVKKCSWCETLIDVGKNCSYCRKINYYALMKSFCILCQEDIEKTKEHFVQYGNFCKRCVNKLSKNI